MDTAVDAAQHNSDRESEESGDEGEDEPAYVKPHVNVFEVVVVEGKRQRKAVDRSLPDITEPAKKKKKAGNKGPKTG